MKVVAGSKRRKLAVEAYEALEECIATLRLAPGAAVTESELAAQMGFGRTPLREALLRLAREHLVQILPHRGVLITPVEVGPQLAALETRRVLDRLIAERAATRAAPEQRARLREIAREIVASSKGPNLTAFMRLDREFDGLIEASARNPFAVHATAPLHALSRRFWFYHRGAGDLRRAAEVHAQLMLAVAGGDAVAAGKASDRLIDYLEAFARSAMDL